jgi:sodium/proline symporter
MSQLDQSLLILTIVYVLVLIGISLYRTNRTQEMADHVLAGRRIGPITTGLSASSSLERGLAVFSIAAIAFDFRLFMIGVSIAIIVGLWASWKLVAPRLRRFTFAAQNALTLPEFLERRFDDRTGALRVVAAALTLLFVLFYVSAGIMAGGVLFNVAFDISVAVGGLITLLVVLAYIFIGGYIVVARTDVFQSIMTLIGMAVLVVAVYVVMDNPTAGIVDTFSDPLGDIGEYVNVFLFLLFMVGMAQGAFGAQRLLQRFMAAKSEAVMDTSRRISTSWLLIIFGFSILLGIFGENALPQVRDYVLTHSMDIDVELQFFYWLAEYIESPVLGAIALSAFLAAVMSTMDSQMLIGASVATSDLPIMRRFAQRKRFEFILGAYMRVWIGRIMLIFIGLAAWLLAQSQPNSVLTFLTYAWLGMGGTFGPVILLSLYWRRFNFYGAMAALIAGGLLTLVCMVTGVHFGTFGGLTLGVLPIAVLVTLVTKAPSAEVQEAFDQGIAKTETT